jgi:hypothetical protein
MHLAVVLRSIRQLPAPRPSDGPGSAGGPAREVLGERTNVSTPSGGESGAASQSLTKQWVRLRQQLAEAKATNQVKDAHIGRLEQRVQQLQAELRDNCSKTPGACPDAAAEYMCRSLGRHRMRAGKCPLLWLDSSRQCHLPRDIREQRQACRLVQAMVRTHMQR